MNKEEKDIVDKEIASYITEINNLITGTIDVILGESVMKVIKCGNYRYTLIKKKIDE